MSSMTASLPSLLPPGHVHMIVVCYVCVCVVCVCVCAHECACVVCVPVCVLYGMNVCGERGGGVWKD